MKRLLLTLFIIAFAIGLLRAPLMRAVSASYDMTVRVVSSAGTVLDGTASAVSASYDRTVRIVDSTGHVIDSFGGGGGGGVTCTAGTTPVAVGTIGCNTAPVTSAQLKAIVGNSVTIVAAPGVGKLIAPISCTLSYTFSGAAYTGGDIPALLWASQANGDTPCTFTVGTITAAASRFGMGTVPGGAEVTANDVNQPIVFGDDVNYATGSGTLSITVVYTVITP